MKRIASQILVLILLFGTVSAASANTLRLQAGIWPGQLTPELEQRFFLDDLIAGTGFGRFDLEMSGKDETTAWFPWGLEYHRQMGPGGIVLALNGSHFNPELKYTGLLTSPAVSLVTLSDYTQTNIYGEVGYRVPVMGGKLKITPRFGVRSYHEEFTYDELTLGNTVQVSLEGPWTADSRGLYLGMDLRYQLLGNLDFVFDLKSTMGLPTISGSLKHQRTVVGVSGSTVTLFYDDATADVETETFQWGIGFEFHLTEKLHLFGGIRRDELTVRYPGYFNLPLVITGSSASLAGNIVAEFVTDYVFYNQDITTEKTFFTFGIAYDLSL